MKRNPFADVEELIERMSGELPMGVSGVQVDLVDRGDALVLHADLPGFDRDEIELTLHERTLSIRADRETETAETDEEGRYLRRERTHSEVSRSVSLPEAVDAEDVTASYTNGVLEVRLPKREAEDTHRIDVS